MHQALENHGSNPVGRGGAYTGILCFWAILVQRRNKMQTAVINKEI